MPYVRCSHCESRRTLARAPTAYTKVPKCRRCGRTKYRIDKYRHAFERGKAPKAGLCYPGRGGCNSYHFPHKKGSGICEHNPNLTAEDLRKLREGE